MRYSDDDFHHLIELMHQAGKNILMKRFNFLSDGDIRQKTSDFDVVSIADEEAETFLSKALVDRHPKATIIGEEAASKTPALLDEIETASLAFIIDPLDGTKNFASGIPAFGIMVSVVSQGNVIAGVIHDPVSNVSVVARQGQGAWQLTEGRSKSKLQVAAAPKELEKFSGIVGTNFLPMHLRKIVNGNMHKIGTGCWLRCAAHEYRLAAAGHCHFLFYNKLMPWDHAAGWLLHREAGGYSAHFDGTPYRPSDLSGGLICAPDINSWQLIRDGLFEQGNTEGS